MIIAKDIVYFADNNKDKLLDKVSITLTPGKITGILGANGAGKSLLMKCLSGSISPSQGTISLDNIPLHKYSLRQLAKRRAYLSQSSSAVLSFTSMDIVLMGRYPFFINGDYKPEDRLIAQHAMKKVGIWHLRDRIFSKLSGGEKQLVNCSRVLAQLWGQKNCFLFLDEPTSSLDIGGKHRFLNMLLTIATQNEIAVCIIMHDVSLAAQISDEIILLVKGKVCDYGSPKEVCSKNNISEAFSIPHDLLYEYNNTGTLLPESHLVIYK